VVPQELLTSCPLYGKRFFVILHYYINYKARGVIQMEYKDTLNLPKTKFKMKANLAREEPKLLEFWEEQETYKKVLKKKKNREKNILNEGPNRL